MQLSLNIRAVISQRLLPATGGGRAAALEIMLDTPRVKDLIRARRDPRAEGRDGAVDADGCQTFDSALYALCAAGRITEEEALANADSPNNVKIKMTQLDLRQSGPMTAVPPAPAPRSVSTGSALGLAAA